MSTERYFYIEVIKVVENDGYTALRRGMESQEETLTWREFVSRYPYDAKKLLSKLEEPLV